MIRIMLSIMLFIGNYHALTWHELNQKQKHTAKVIYRVVDDLDLRLALLAIAWQESRLGVASVNLQDPSCGVFHIHLKYYNQRYGLKDNDYTRNILCARLINDLVFSIREAKRHLRTWLVVHNGDFEKALKSYNAGYNVNAGNDYYANIMKHKKDFLEMIESGDLR